VIALDGEEKKIILALLSIDSGAEAVGVEWKKILCLTDAPHYLRSESHENW